MVDVEHFISEVKRHPVLWDPNHSDYNQRHSKLGAWKEVCSNLYVDWNDLSKYEKFGKVRDIQTRWKNLRDSYTRELKYERKVEKGLALAKKNKYKYSHLLEFLNAGQKRKVKGSDQSSTTDMEETPEKKEVNQSNIDFSELKHKSEESSLLEVDQKTDQVKPSVNRRAKRLKPNNLSTQFNLQSDSSTMDSDSNNLMANKNAKRAKEENISKEMPQEMSCSVEIERNINKPYRNSDKNGQHFEDFFNSTRKVNAEYLSPTIEISSGFSLPLEQDDDKMFLLSLLPYFKKLNEERKLQARIEMSTFLQNFIYKKS